MKSSSTEPGLGSGPAWAQDASSHPFMRTIRNTPPDLVVEATAGGQGRTRCQIRPLAPSAVGSCGGGHRRGMRLCAATGSALSHLAPLGSGGGGRCQGRRPHAVAGSSGGGHRRGRRPRTAIRICLLVARSGIRLPGSTLTYRDPHSPTGIWPPATGVRPSPRDVLHQHHTPPALCSSRERESRVGGERARQRPPCSTRAREREREPRGRSERTPVAGLVHHERGRETVAQVREGERQS